MLPLFAATIFLAATLLFVVEPMAAKLILPLLGGSPAVWNTCMVFFQAMLLGGYLGAHLLSRLSTRIQSIIYISLLCLPIVASMLMHRLIVASPRELPEPAPDSPISWGLLALTFMVGAPFLLLSAAAPLLQRWFAATTHRSARDPYFLYAASNAGSMLGLLGYPLFIEPWLTLPVQRRAWSIAFSILALLIALCAAAARRERHRPPAQAAAPKDHPAAAIAPSWRTRALWILLAFVPSSLTLGVTQFLSTDIAAMPLVWVVPLALYLLTFIIAFAASIRTDSISRLLPVAIVAVAMTFFIRGYHLPAWALFTLHLGTLFLAALLCHARLSASRPGAARLTEFYLFVALGGVLGGIFNTLLAPVLFRSIAEYPIMLVLVCLLRTAPPGTPGRTRRRLLLAVDAAIIASIAAIMLWADSIARLLRFPDASFVLGLRVGVPPVLCYLLTRRRIAFAAGVSVLLAMPSFVNSGDGLRLLSERTFFGVYRVTRGGGFTKLTHGTTDHGMQSTDPARQRTPLTYYHPDSPIGRTFGAFADTPLFSRVGLVGLGTGALAAYARPGQHLTYHEIDPAVARIAENPGFFTYLRDCRGRYDISLGDGRLTLGAVPDGEYGLIVLDAFSSDAIPIHLMTLEAVDIYTSKLRPHGLIAFHISNQFFDLAPIIRRLAAERGLAMIERNQDVEEIAQDLAGDAQTAPAGAVEPEARRLAEDYLAAGPSLRPLLADRILRETGRYPSHWILLARDRADFGPLLTEPSWRSPPSPAGTPLWTDDYSNILSVFQWR